MQDTQPADLPTILFVGSRADVRQDIQTMMARAPYRLVLAADHAALTVTDELPPALIILDGALGAAACTQLKAHFGASVPILFIVDSLDPSVLDTALEAGADDTIQYPIHDQTFHRRLHLLLSQRENRERNSQLETILNNSGDAIIVTGLDGNIRRVNHAFHTLFGFASDQYVAQPFFDLAASYDQSLLRETLRLALESRSVTRVEVVLRRADSGLFNADVAISPIQVHDDQSMGLICSVRDITETKRMELELRHALAHERELSELKSRFVATASHEFRTPLAMIMTSSELLQRYSARMSDEQKAQRFERIQIEVKIMARLLDDVLTVNRSVAAGALEFDPSPLDAAAFCGQIIDELRYSDAEAHPIVLSCTGDNTVVNLDKQLLKSILTNLLSNAIKFSSSETEIAVKLHCEPQQTVIIVQDRGIGIPEEDQIHLFEAFHRGKNVGTVSGTGLGLTLAQQAVELHGGTITLTSKVGVGTTFIVTIPNVVIEDSNYDSQNSRH